MLTALTAVTVLVVSLAPGLLLGFVAPPGRDRLIAWAAAPVLSLGLVTLASGWQVRLGLPNGAGPVLVGELVVAAVAALGAWLVRRHRTSVSARSWFLGRSGAGRVDLGALCVSVAVTIAATWLLLGRLPYPPAWDAMNHAYLTRRILDTGSTAMADVCTSGSLHPVLACDFYPIAANVQWAQGAWLSGGHISVAMAAWSIALAPAALAAAVFVSVRRLGGRTVIAGAAAAATSLIGPVWLSIYMGRINEQAVPALAVTVALLAALALCGRHPLRLGALAGMGAAGVAVTHTYDVLFLLVLGLAFIPALYAGRGVRHLLKGAGAAVLAGLVTIAPFLTGILGASGARESAQPRFAGQLGAAFDYWVSDPTGYVLYGYPTPGGHLDSALDLPVSIALAITLLALAAAPFALFFTGLRWARPWLVAWLVFTALGIWTSTSDSAPAQAIAGLWYGDPDRLRTMIRPVYGVLAVAGACVIGLALHRLAQRLRSDRPVAPRDVEPHRPRAAARAAAMAAAGLVGVLTLVGATPAAWAPIRADLSHRVPQGPSYQRTYRWLAQHTPPGTVVAYDRHTEYMTWSYADYGVEPLWGIPPLVPANKHDYDDRMRAFQWLAGGPGIEPAGCLVDHFGIAYVAVGGPAFNGWPAHYSTQQIAASPNVSLVHQDGALRVYQVTDAGRACQG